MNIRKAQLSDAKPLEDFLVLIYGEDYRVFAKRGIASMFSGDCYHPNFILAEYGGGLVGAAAYSEEMFTVGVWGISWVSVHPDQRNQGLGQQLVEFCCACISDEAKSVATALLLTYPDQTKLYDNMGFKKSGQDHEGGWFMTKTLKMF